MALKQGAQKEKGNCSANPILLFDICDQISQPVTQIYIYILGIYFQNRVVRKKTLRREEKKNKNEENWERMNKEKKKERTDSEHDGTLLKRCSLSSQSRMITSFLK